MKEALKLALEALQLVSIEFVCNGAHHAKKDRHDWLESCPIVERYQAAITAIKEALAPTSTQCEAQPEQEPVALQMDVIVVNLVREGINKHRARELAEHFIKNTTPPQRPWVGLTNEDMYELGEFANTHGYVPTPAKRMFAKIEAKLKEKNT